MRPNEQSTKSVKYSRQDSLFDIKSDSKVYYLQEVEDERYQVIFGDGIFGNKLEDNNFITVNYITSSGDAANGVNQFHFCRKIGLYKKFSRIHSNCWYFTFNYRNICIWRRIY